jgi:hypothetical protein
MSGKTIGKTFNHGFAGSYARHPEQIIVTRPNGDTNPIPFGAPVAYDNGKVKNVAAGFTAAAFAGIASKEVKSQLDYLNQNEGGKYVEDEAVSVFQRGSINVLVPSDSPAVNSPVYVRVVAAAPKKVGDFESTPDSTNNVLIPNARFGGPKDANNIAELVLLTRANA